MLLVTRARQLGMGLRYLRRMTHGRRATLAHLRAPGVDNLPMPTFVQLRLTNICNLRCKMCGQWGDTGVITTSAAGPRASRTRRRE
jgi:hypothetical protein